jgi:predicted nucleotidyltransferase
LRSKNKKAGHLFKGIRAMITNDQINRITSILVKEANPQSIILFGSYARGEARNESDIDLCVIENPPVDKRAESVRLRRAVSPLRIPVDIIVHSYRTMKDWCEVPGTFIHSIMREGKVLYEKKQ